eukprot:m.293157 g.293157  ORF g.293157 m.293157 type:complete len:262 (-) comp16240_c0_seq2:85-870(-)
MGVLWVVGPHDPCVVRGDGRLLQTMPIEAGYVDSLVANETWLFVTETWHFAHISDVLVWRCSDGRWVKTLVGHTQTVQSLALDKNGRLYSGSDDMTIRVWSASTHTHIQTLRGHTGAIDALAVGMDGVLFSGSTDCTIREWSATDWTVCRTFLGHTRDVTSLAVGRDGTLFSGSDDHSVRVWRLGSEAVLLAEPQSFVRAVCVTPDGRLYVGHTNGPLRCWSVRRLINPASIYNTIRPKQVRYSRRSCERSKFPSQKIRHI